MKSWADPPGLPPSREELPIRDAFVAVCRAITPLRDHASRRRVLRAVEMLLVCVPEPAADRAQPKTGSENASDSE